MEEYFQYYTDGKLKSAMAGGMRYEYNYYADGRLKEKTASGRTLLAYEYDLNGNLISQKDVTGKVMKYGYAGNGNLLNKKGLAGETGYEYDSLNRLIKTTYLEYTEQFTYDKAGNRTSYQVNILTGTGTLEMLKKQSAGGNKGIGNKNIQYTYDNCNRLLTKTDITQENITSTRTEYTYDICGNFVGDGENIYIYDGFNRLSQVEKATGENFVYRYDGEGLRAEVEENGRLVQYIFNREREVVTEISEEKGAIRYLRGLELICSDTESARNYYHYAANSRGEHSDDDKEKGNYNYPQNKEECSNIGGKYYYYVADEHGSISYILNEKADIENEYTYNAFGNIISSKENVYNVFAYNGTYDADDLLIKEEHRELGGDIQNSYTYEYDKAENSAKVTDVFGVPVTYKYDRKNRLIKILEKMVVFYDKNDRIEKVALPKEVEEKGEDAKGYRYQYDVLDRITSLTGPDGILIYERAYNPYGELEQETDNDHA